MSIKAMKQALEALELIYKTMPDSLEASQTITALRAAIEAAEKVEPKCHATETLCSTCDNDFRKCVRFTAPQPDHNIELTEVKQQRDELLKDAMRYRWLRDNKHLDIWWSMDGPADRCENINADIDAAMKGEQR